MRGAREGLALYGLGIAAGTAIECPGNPADGSDADPRALVDVAVRHALEQQRHHPPAIAHGPEFGRRAQVLEERSHVLCPVEDRKSGVQAKSVPSRVDTGGSRIKKNKHKYISYK